MPSYHDADGSHAMTVEEIEEVIAGFIAAAVRARQSGFDGVEEFDEVVFSGDLNKVLGPVKTQFGYHLIEVTNRW